MRGRDFFFSLVRVLFILAVIGGGVYYYNTYFAYKLSEDPGVFWGNFKTGLEERYSPAVKSRKAADDLLAQATKAYKDGKFDDAKTLAGESIKLYSGNPSAHSLVAMVIGKAEGNDAAAAYLEGKMAAFPDDKDLHSVLASMYDKAGKPDKATGVIESFAAAHPDDASIQNVAGWWYARHVKDNEKAREYFEKAVAKDSENKDGYEGLLAVEQDRNKKKEYLNKLVELEPDNSNYSGELGWMEFEDGAYDRALLFSRQAVTADPKAHYAHFNAALAQLMQKDYAGSWETYVAAVAGCINEKSDYPFEGALSDLKTVQNPENAQFLANVVALIAKASPFAKGGASAYMDKYGEDAYVFSGKDLISGMDISLAGYKGKLVFVDFWASWCGPCVGELPNVVELNKTLGSDKFSVVSVSLDEKGAEEALGKLIAANGITYPVIYSGEGWSNPAAKSYGINYIPNTWVISPEGKIVFHDLRGKDPLRYCQAYLAGGAAGVSPVTITETLSGETLSFTATAPNGGNIAADVSFFAPLAFGGAKPWFEEKHHFTDTDGEIESTVDIPPVGGGLGYVFWSVQCPAAGIPDPFTASGVIAPKKPAGADKPAPAASGDAGKGA